MNEGLYVTFEGIDGSGTTSVTKQLNKLYTPHSMWTCEPSQYWTGEAARAAFEEHDAHDLTRFYLFMADRVEHEVKFVRPWRDEGQLILSDRGPDSTRAYQHFSDGLTDLEIEGHLQKTMDPDLTMWLDVDVDTAAERMDGDDAFENKEFQEQVAVRYQAVYEQHDRIKRIDANQGLDAVIADSKEVIDDALERQ